MSNAGVPLIARVYLTLGTWKKTLSPALDDDSIQGTNNVSFLALHFNLLFETIFIFFISRNFDFLQ